MTDDGGYRGGRGGGGFRGGRGTSDDNGGGGGYRGGRGDDGDNGGGGRGGYRGGRGGGEYDGGRGGSRGGYNNDGPGRGGGGFHGGRGYGDDDDGGNRGGFRGRGGYDNDGAGRGGGGYRGGRGNDDDSDAGGRGGYRGGRGNYGGDDDGGNRGGFRGGRGGFSHDDNGGGRGGYGGGGRGGRGGYGDNEGGGRGGYDGGSRGGRGGYDNESGGRGGRGGYGDREGGGRGGYDGGGRGGRGGFDNEGGGRGGRGGFGDRDGGGRGGRGGYGDNEDGGRGRGGYEGGRGGRGGFSHDDNEDGGGRGGRGGYSRGGFEGDRPARGDFDAGGRGGGRGFSRGGDDGEFRGGRGGGRGGGGTDFESGFRRGDGDFGPKGRRGDDEDFGGRTFTRTEFHQNREGGGLEGEEEDESRAPRFYTPDVRPLEELYQEDIEASENYAHIDDDDDVIVEGDDDRIQIEKWEDAELPPALINNVKRMGFVRPRKIQKSVIPLILDNFDVKGHAETGSGKTAAYLIPIISECVNDKVEGKYASEPCMPYAVIVATTRELVMQIYEQAAKLANDTGVSVAKAYGQYSVGRNRAELEMGCDILCATPGRLKHFITGGIVFSERIRFFVLDEADYLLDEGFLCDIRDIMQVETFPNKDKRQTLLFSATFPEGIQELSKEMLREGRLAVVTNKKNNSNKRITHKFHVLERPEKIDFIKDLLTAEIAEAAGDATKLRRTLIFVSTRRMADTLATFLNQKDIPSFSLSGAVGQHLRERAINGFRRKEVTVLVATDVCARGIDIKDLDHVINFDLPDTVITYVHRVGRTGRIRPGNATSIVDVSRDRELLIEIENDLKASGKDIPESLAAALSGDGGDNGGGSDGAPAAGGVIGSAIVTGAAEEDDW